MPPMTSRRAGAREIRIGFGVRGSGFREDTRASEYSCPCHPNSFFVRARRMGMGSVEEAGAGGWLGGGGNFFLAFEDDAVEESAAGGGAENGRQHVGFGFVDLWEGELESVGAGGAVPAGALVFEGGDGADPGVGEARAARVGVGDAIVEDFEHQGA